MAPPDTGLSASAAWIDNWSTSGSLRWLQFWVPIESAGPNPSEYHAAVVVSKGLDVRVARGHA